MIQSGSRILVTGGTGFIGGRLVERLFLEHDVTVRVLARNPTTAVRVARFPVEVFWGDVTDEECVLAATRGCNLVFHCAHDTTSLRGHRASAYHGTGNVARAALDAGVQRMVHLSSFVVYGHGAAGELTEESVWREASGKYTSAKRAGEKLVLAMHRSHGLPVSVLQPTIVYGPFGGAWTKRPVELLRSGLVPLIDGGSGSCNAVYVDDVVDAILLAASAPKAVGERFLISGEEPVSWKRFYGAFEELLGGASTIDVAIEQLPRLRRWEHQRARRLLLDLLTDAGRNTLRKPETLNALLELQSARVASDVVMRLLPDRRWRALKKRVRERSSARSAVDQPRRKVHLPDAHETALYASRARVRIDKARDLLGYAPRFPFDRGMALTGEYLRWSRLV